MCCMRPKNLRRYLQYVRQAEKLRQKELELDREHAQNVKKQEERAAMAFAYSDALSGCAIGDGSTFSESPLRSPSALQSLSMAHKGSKSSGHAPTEPAKPSFAPNTLQQQILGVCAFARKAVTRTASGLNSSRHTKVKKGGRLRGVAPTSRHHRRRKPKRDETGGQPTALIKC